MYDELGKKFSWEQDGSSETWWEHDFVVMWIFFGLQKPWIYTYVQKITILK